MMKKEVNDTKQNEFTKEDFMKQTEILKIKVTDAEKKIMTLENGLKEENIKRDKAQGKLNEIIRKSSEDLVNGKATGNDTAIEAKQGLDVIVLLINNLESSAIPNAKAELEKAKGDLLNGTKELLDQLRQSYKSRMDEEIRKGLLIGVEFINLADKIIHEAGIIGKLSSFEVEPILIIRPNVGQGYIHPNHLRLMGLDR